MYLIIIIVIISVILFEVRIRIRDFYLKRGLTNYRFDQFSIPRNVSGGNDATAK